MYGSSVMQPLLVTTFTIKHATENARMILKVRQDHSQEHKCSKCIHPHMQTTVFPKCFEELWP